MTRTKTGTFFRRMFFLVCLSMIFAALPGPGPARGEVVFDGSLGDPGSLSGDMVISSDRGRTAGDNLFHSFEIFNVNTGESALFTGPANIANIISRVTGGDLSTIDGSIDHTMAGAAFWLINPNGVVFGANASLPTTGSFHVASADYLELGEEGRFGADLSLPENTVLSVASPSAYGFVGPGLTGGVVAEGANLELDDGETLSMVGGGVILEDGTQVNVAQGMVNLGAAGAAGELPVDLADVSSADGIAAGGILMSASGINTDGPGGGSIYIRGGEFVMADSYLSGNTEGSSDGGAIDIDVNNFLMLGQSFIQTLIGGPGKGSDISISASDLLVMDLPDANWGIYGVTFSEGNVGSINLHAGNFYLSGGAILSLSAGSGNGGDISVVADDFLIENFGTIQSLTSGPGFGGNISLDLGTGLITGYGAIDSVTSGGGEAGNITLEAAGTLIFEGEFGTGISSRAPAGTGSTGSVVVSAGDLAIRGGAGIIVVDNINSVAAGGYITIDVQNQLTIEGFDPNIQNISTNANGFVRGGDISISAAEFNLDFGNISSWAPLDGDAGNININVDRFQMEGGIINSKSGFYTFGNSGDITINASESILMTGSGATIDPENISTEEVTLSFLLTNTLGSGAAGDISLNSPAIDIDNTLISSETGSGSLPIATDGPGGDIGIAGGVVTLGENSSVASGTFGDGEGGNIRIDVEQLVMNDGAAIGADTFGFGNAGNIEIHADDLILLQGASQGDEPVGSRITSTAFGDDREGYFSGDGGSVSIFTRNLKLLDGGVILCGTVTDGNAGDINVVATDSIQISGFTPPVSLSGLITQSIFQYEGVSGGEAGNITLQTGDLQILDGGVINSATQTSGDAGLISIIAENVDLRDTVGTSQMGISVSTLSSEENAGSAGGILVDAGSMTLEGVGSTIRAESLGSGIGGIIEVQADHLNILNDGDISTGTQGSGRAGDIVLNVQDEIIIQGEESARENEDTGIFANTFGSGDAGIIQISASKLGISGTGTIQSGTESSGNGGEIQMDLGSLTMDGNNQILTASHGEGDAGDIVLNLSGSLKIDGKNAPEGFEVGIFSNSRESGQGGDLEISANKIVLKNGGRLSASSSGSGNAGTILVTARDDLKLDGGFIQTRADNSSGGSIFLDVGNYVFLDHSEITTSSQGVTPGNDGGNITVDPTFIILKESDILAQANAGNGGNITLVAESLLVDPFSTIDATSQTGIDGEVVVDAPNQDITGGLVALDASIIDVSSFLRRRCAIQTLSDRSSFTVERTGGLVDSPETFAVGLHPADSDLDPDRPVRREGPIPVHPPNEKPGDNPLDEPTSKCPNGCPE